MKAKMTTIAIIALTIATIGAALATPPPLPASGKDGWRHAKGPVYQLDSMMETLKGHFKKGLTFADADGSRRSLETAEDLKVYLEVSRSGVDVQKPMHLYLSKVDKTNEIFWVSNHLYPVPPYEEIEKESETKGGAIGNKLREIHLKATEGNKGFKAKVKVQSFSGKEQEELREAAKKLGIKIDLSETIGATTIVRYFSASTEEWIEIMEELEEENAELRARCDELLRDKYQKHFETANEEIHNLEALKKSVVDEAQLREIDEWLAKWKGVRNKSPFQFVSITGPQFSNSPVKSKMGGSGIQSYGHNTDNTILNYVEDNSVNIGDNAVNPLVIIMGKAGSGAQLDTITVHETTTRIKSLETPQSVWGTVWD